MGLETGTYIDDLVATNPVGASDQKAQGDDHLRLIKSTILNTFPNITAAMTATHTELNYLDGVTSPTGSGALVLGTAPTIDQLTVTTSISLPSASIADAALSANVPLLDGSNVWSAAQTIQATQVDLYFVETDATSDEKRWRWLASAGDLYLQTRTDANGGGDTPIYIQRTGTTVDEIQLAATTFDLNGTLNLNGGQHQISGSELTLDNGTDGFLDVVDTAAPEVRFSIGAARRAYLEYVEADSDFYIDSDGGIVFRTNNNSTFELSTGGGVTTPNANANEVGFKGLPRGTHTSSYTAVLADAGGLIYFGSHSGLTFTIPANASVAFPIGTVLTVINYDSAAMTIAITSDTLELAASGATPTTLAGYGVATFIKVSGAAWFGMGAGLT